MGSLLAVAGLTVRAALRLRAFWAVALLLLAVGLLLPPTLRDDGTAVGRARVLLTYTLGLGQGLLCLATVWLAADAIGRDLTGRQIDLLATKPVPRATLWLGKWLGVVALDAALLMVLGVVVYAQLTQVSRSPRWTSAQVSTLTREVLLPRTRRLPAPPAPRTPSPWREVAPAQSAEWRYPGACPDGPNDVVTVRLRAQAAGDLPGSAAIAWRITGESDAPAYEGSASLQSGAWTDLRAPAGTPRDPLGCRLTVTNRSRVALLFASGDGPFVLYRDGSLAGSFGRALLLLWLQLAFLAALGLAVGGLFSFPVASFVLLSYLVIAACAPLLGVAAGQGTILADEHAHHQASPGLELAADLALRAGLWLTDPLHAWWPLGDLAGGYAVDRVGLALLQIGLRTAVVALAGVWLWSRRELSGAES